MTPLEDELILVLVVDAIVADVLPVKDINETIRLDVGESSK
jgi:hypothetical protein